MGGIFEAVLYQPLFNLFVALYNLIPDVGVVILIVTIIVKIILYPLTNKSIQAQKSLTDLQPKMEELKQKHKDNQQMLAQETMKLYKEHKVNPFGSCLPILIQLPIFLALYWVLRDGLTKDSFELLYASVPNPGSISPLTVFGINLSVPNIVLAALAGIAQYWQAKMFVRKQAPKKAGEAGKDENMMAIMNKQMLYFMPIMTVIIGFQLPGGLSLYWFLSTLLTGLQQVYLMRSQENKKEDGVIEGKIVK